MSFFGEEGFGIEDLFNQLANGEGFAGNANAQGGMSKNYRKTGRIPAKQIVISKGLFLVFDFAGEKEINLEVKDGKGINRYGERVNTGKKVLEIKNSTEVIGEYVLPDKIKMKGFEDTFINGILEVKFRR